MQTTTKSYPRYVFLTYANLEIMQHRCPKFPVASKRDQTDPSISIRRFKEGMAGPISSTMCKFNAQHGVNVTVGPKEDRLLMTGLHTVADIYCNCCQQVLGWKYEQAFEESQKYKEGKYILEKAKMFKEGNW
eukprot:scaffold776_cov347-Pavlova_lutheri.AAC.42